MYYGAGLISAVDRYPEIEKEIPANLRKATYLHHKDDLKSSLYDGDIMDDISVVIIFFYVIFKSNLQI